MIITFTVLLVIILKLKLQVKMKKVVDKLITSFVGISFTTNQWKVCFDRLSDEKLFDFSVINLFSIDFSFLISFVGAVISFSILFIQMEEKH